MDVVDEWIRHEPIKACDELLPTAEKGNPRSILLLQRIAKLNPENRQVSGGVISFYLQNDLGWSMDVDFGRDGAGLYSFGADDFTSQTRQIIHDALRSEKPSPKILLACGTANMKKEVPVLKRLLSTQKAGSGDEGYVRLALARLGDEEEIQNVIRRIDRKITESPGSIQYYLRCAGYIRQPEGIKYLNGVLSGDKELPAPVPGMQDSGVPYAEFALDVLTQCVSGFPISWKEGRGYSEEDIRTAREWMNRQQEWKIIR